jgi:hypothetical protein
MFPQVLQRERVGAESFMFAAFLLAALAFEVLYFGVAIVLILLHYTKF